MNNTLKRAFSIVELLAKNPNMGLTEISTNLGLSKSTVHNIVTTLTTQGILEKNHGTSRYHLGIKLIELGYIAQGDVAVRQVAYPHLRRLNEELDETIHLTVLDNRQVLYIDCIESRKRLRTYSVIGVRAQLHCTSVGKAIMAFLPPDEINSIIDSIGFKKYTSNTITDKQSLHKELERIRETGYAIDNMEHENGLRCVGAPIFGNHNEVFASLSVSGPETRVTMEKVEEIAPILLEATHDISRKMGARL
ncbi:MAG: IclR family transcriptional regulator [Spirochaetota bacterium]|nr:IclR family transcriptional regulator [Spirochaetota bacterium]